MDIDQSTERERESTGIAMIVSFSVHSIGLDLLDISHRAL